MSHQYQQTSDQYGQTSGQYGQTSEYGRTGGQRSGGQGGGQQMGGQQLTGQPSDQQMIGQTGGQYGGAQQIGGGSTGTRTRQPRAFEDHMTDELRIALEDFGELSHVAAWCAKECAAGGAELGVCARICQDVAEIAALNEMLIARDSMFGPEVADLFLRIGTEALAELQRFDRHPHVVETIATIDRTMNSCETVLQQVGGQRMGGQTAPPQTGQQYGQASGQQYGQTGGHQYGQPGSQEYGQASGQQYEQIGSQPVGRGSGEYGTYGPPEQGQHGQESREYPTGGQRY